MGEVHVERSGERTHYTTPIDMNIGRFGQAVSGSPSISGDDADLSRRSVTEHPKANLGGNPADKRRNNNVIMTSKRRCNVLLTSRRRYYCGVCPLGRYS